MIAAPPPPPPAAVAPIQRYFKDWLLVCDNGGLCTAKAIPADPDDGLAAIGMTVEREAGPQAALSVTIFKSDDPMDPAETVLDDTPLHPPYRKDKDGALHLSGAPAVAFLRQVRQGGLLRGAHTDDGPWVRLSGLSAALLAMDEAQGRVGTVTAIVRPGPKPASAVPPPPPLPVVRAAAPPPPRKSAAALAKAVRAGQAAALKAEGCEASGNLPDDEAHPLNTDEALVILGCGMGAYQSWSLAFRTPRAAPAQATRLRLPAAPSAGDRRGAENGSYVEAAYDEKTATFGTHARGRGVGDCGYSSTWVFDGAAFNLSFHEEQTRCGGESLDWPTVFRARVLPAR